MPNKQRGTRPRGRNGPQRGQRRPSGPAVSGNGAARTPLLPMGVNNKATAPPAIQSYSMQMEEVMDIVAVPQSATIGSVVYSALITPAVCQRLKILACAFQRIDWNRASVHLVALNGSTIKSGYTMGFLEDPELAVPETGKDVIPFLTALRTTTVRQAWVESEVGHMVLPRDRPEMYTQPGSDLRRYSPGRVVVAFAGSPGDIATFQVMLRYSVRLYVSMADPRSLIPPAPPVVRPLVLGNTTGLALPYDGGETGFDVIPNLGVTLLPEKDYFLTHRYNFTFGDGATFSPEVSEIAFVAGFRTPTSNQLATPSAYQLLLSNSQVGGEVYSAQPRVPGEEAREARVVFAAESEFVAP